MSTDELELARAAANLTKEDLAWVRQHGPQITPDDPESVSSQEAPVMVQPTITWFCYQPEMRAVFCRPKEVRIIGWIAKRCLAVHSGRQSHHGADRLLGLRMDHHVDVVEMMQYPSTATPCLLAPSRSHFL